MKSDNNLMWDKEVMVALLVVGLEFIFACMMMEKISERALNTFTTYPVSCLICNICRDFGVRHGSVIK